MYKLLLYTFIGCSLLTLQSCRTHKEGVKEVQTISRGIDILQDSTRHTWITTRLIQYRPDGTTEQAIEREEHDKQTAITQVKDTVFIYIDRAVSLENTPEPTVIKEAKETARAGAWQIWGIVVLVIIGIITYLVIRWKRRIL